MRDLHALVAAVRREYAPEPRTAIFEVRLDARDDGFVFTGVTTEPDAVEDLLTRAAALVSADRLADEIVRLPDPMLGGTSWAVVRAGLAPVHGAPDIRATQVSQYLLGTRLQLLLPTGRWFRVRGEDGYLGWVNRGYIEPGEESWAHAWQAAAGAYPAVSLGAELVDDDGAPILRLPWGARVAYDGGRRCTLPDGRAAVLAGGELVPEADLPELFPAAGEAIVESARRWTGAPYLWGGVTMAGVDCSGFVQAVFRMHGVQLPRDAELQVGIGSRLDPGPAFQRLRPGDLLFFTEVPGRITHVAVSMGGAGIIHSALSNGGVATNDLRGGGELQPALNRMFVEARRVL